MGVVNLHRKEGGHVQPDLGGQYHRILQIYKPPSDATMAGRRQAGHKDPAQTRRIFLLRWLFLDYRIHFRFYQRKFAFRKMHDFMFLILALMMLCEFV